MPELQPDQLSRQRAASKNVFASRFFLILQQARGPIYLAQSLTPKFEEILYSGITRMLLCVRVIKMIRIPYLATARLPSMRSKRTFRQGNASSSAYPAKIASWSRLSLLHQPLILSARR